jgi:UDP-glucose 4-epimerase
MGKKIIITGGLGYIGTELCKIYSGFSWKDKIIVIDNLSEGVLCECTSPSIAQSVSLGFINSSIKILPSSIPWLEKNYYYNFKQ